MVRIGSLSVRDNILLGWYLFLRDFNNRYRQAFFGQFWAVLKPIMIGVPVVMLSLQFRPEATPEELEDIRDQVPRAASSFIGLLYLSLFWESLTYSQMIPRRARHFIKRSVFPTITIMFASCFYVLFFATIYVVLAVIAILIFKAPVSHFGLLALAMIPVVILTGHSIGLFLAPISLVYLDVRFGLPILFPAVLMSVPILYRFHELKGNVLLFVKWNPLTSMIEVSRSLLFHGTPGDFGFLLLICVGCFAILGLIGLRFFKRAMRIAVDQI